MADDLDAVAPRMMRPHDLCTAAYYGDVEKLKELLTVEAVEDEPPIDPEFDPLAPADEEAIASAADRAARRAANAAEISKRLSATRRIVTRLSPVNVQEYGIFLTATEAFDESTGNFVLVPKVKTSRRSTFEASPLHWAVLGCEHAAITYLVTQGADVDQRVAGLDLTAADIIELNGLLETRKVLAKAIQMHKEIKDKEQAATDERSRVLADRDAQRERAQEEVRRKEEEERLEAERAAQQEADGTTEAAADEAAPEGDE
jgi:hypothetical protein